MSYFSQEFAKPNAPEWKSDWRKEFERRSAEDKRKPKLITAPQIKVRQERPTRKPVMRPRVYPRLGEKRRRDEWKEKDLCRSCGRDRAPGRLRCGKCLERTRLYYAKKNGIEMIPVSRDRTCATCGTLLHPRNRYGHCRKHFRLLPEQAKRSLRIAA
jgi:hypothetical protein